MSEPEAITAFRERLPRIKAGIDYEWSNPLIRAATVPARGFRYGKTFHLWIIRDDTGRYVLDDYHGPAEWRSQFAAEVERLNDA